VVLVQKSVLWIWKNLEGIYRGICFVAAICCLILTIIALLRGSAEFWQPFVVFAAVIIMSRLDDLEKFKFGPGGIEATRKVIEKATATISQLQDIAHTQGKTMVEMTHMAGRWGGIPKSTKREIIENTVSELRNIGVSEDRINEINKLNNEYFRRDYYSVLWNKINRNSDQNLNAQKLKLTKVLQEENRIATSSELLKIYSENNLLDENSKKILQEYSEIEQETFENWNGWVNLDKFDE
jgi:hypothetical protein